MHQRLPYHHSEIPPGQKSIYVSIRFGNPTSGDCRNFGICKMEVFEDTVTEFQKQTGYALARLISLSDKLQILFEKSSMTKKCQELYFGKGIFLIESKVIIENHLCRRLKIKDISLQVGRYKVTETSTSYTIEI